MMPNRQPGPGQILEFRQLFQRLHEMRERLQEQGEEDSFSILFEEDMQSRSTTNLFYQTPEMRAEYERYQDFVFINKRL